MRISILLPYKENYSSIYPGAVSLFVKSNILISRYKKDITVFGSTSLPKKLTKNYINISLEKKFFKSRTKTYVENFYNLQKKKPAEIIEIHNRPIYINYLKKLNSKIILYFHNDPLTIIGSKTVKERIILLSTCSKIIFNSEWSKKQFLCDLDNFYIKSPILEVIHQSINKVKIDFKKKENVITFVGKLNTAKGFDIFGSAIIKILNKYKNWKAIVIGDEPREKIYFKHKNLITRGFLEHKKVLSIFAKTNIAVACSRWNEPFGRTSLEAASRGCAVIISNRGGLPETITNGIILNDLSVKALYKSIEKLILNKDYLKKIQYSSLKNFYLTNSFISKKIDIYRNNILNRYNFNTQKFNDISKLKILHVTNFNERHNGRLFYNTGRRINNGFIKLGHTVIELSDRDILSYSRSLNDLSGSKKLNNKLIEIISNFLPDIIIFGHADLIKKETLHFIKKTYPNIRMSQWFLDRMDSHWTYNKKRFLHKIDLMDSNFCTTFPKSLNFNKDYNIHFMPNPVDASFEKLKNYKNKYFNHDIFFAMSHGVHRGVLKKNKFDNREIFINQLIKKTPDIRFDLYGMNDKQPLWADNYLLAISQSKIGLNLSQGKPVKYYSSDRFSQIIGNGLLLMVDEKTQFSDFFNKNEIITYKGINDLSEKIFRFSNDNLMRNKIAKNGRNKYFKYFNSTLVADFIIKKTFNKKKQKFYWE